MRLAVFGGTFDPIHFGHLRIAEEARDRLGFERILFVPNYVSPFKAGQSVTSGEQRAQMVERAIRENPAFSISRWEVEREKPSFTIETIRAIRSQYADYELYFLAGMDAVRDLPKWHEPEELLSLVQFVTATRPGVDIRDVLDALPDDWEKRIMFMEMPGLDISATDLRRRVAEGRSIRYLLPPAVEDYIHAHGLYTGPKSEDKEVKE